MKKQHQCAICDYWYDENNGEPGQAIPPGTAWEDVPESFVCPECGAHKEDFYVIGEG